MHIEKNQTLLGQFWLAGQNSDSAKTGTIDFTKSGAKVNLDGSLTGNNPITDGVIFGIVHGKETYKISLYNCFTTKYRSHYSTPTSAPYLITTIEATEALLGHHIDNPEFYGIEFTVPQTVKWFHDQNFFINSKDLNSYNIEFNAYDEERIEINDKLAIYKIYRTTMPMGEYGVEKIEISRSLFFKITSTTPLKFRELFGHMTHLRRFFEFACQIPLESRDISVFLNKDKLYDSNPYNTSTLFTNNPGTFDFENQLISHIDIRQSLPQKLATWFELRSKSPEPFHRYFDAINKGSENGILLFLWTISAIEELHKIRTKRNGINLKERLEEIIKRWSPAVNISSPSTHINKIKDTRHYYAHGAGDLRNKAAHDFELLRYSYFLIGVFNLEILSLLNYSDEEVIRISNSNFLMSEYLSLSMFPGEDK